MAGKDPRDVHYKDRRLEVLVQPAIAFYKVQEDIEAARVVVDIATSDLETVLRRYSESMLFAAMESRPLKVRMLVGALGTEELRKQINRRQWAEAEAVGVQTYLDIRFRWCEADLPFELVRADDCLLIGVRSTDEPLGHLAPVLRYVDAQRLPALRWLDLFERVWRTSRQIPDLPIDFGGGAA